MFPKRTYTFVNLLKSPTGFTLIEALIAVALLAIVAVGISAPYISGFQALDAQAESMLLDSRLRSKMEELVSTNFGSLSSSFETVTVNGQSFTITWTVVPVDLDGNTIPEPSAVRITVSVTQRPNHSLTTIRVDNEGRVGKIT
ncbi:MAG: prepilin-type N-terminal cleavage/methylation domain-containing protein [Desulfobacterales bacterium]|nr:prepilin-type N-terminal cleavage/methylation domain-containing protein [Desulfobacterales bacterium]